MSIKLVVLYVLYIRYTEKAIRLLCNCSYTALHCCRYGTWYIYICIVCYLVGFKPRCTLHRVIFNWLITNSKTFVVKHLYRLGTFNKHYRHRDGVADKMCTFWEIDEIQRYPLHPSP